MAIKYYIRSSIVQIKALTLITFYLFFISDSFGPLQSKWQCRLIKIRIGSKEKWQTQCDVNTIEINVNSQK